MSRYSRERTQNHKIHETHENAFVCFVYFVVWNGCPLDDELTSMSIGIYIHIPFCQSKCGYCGFVSGPLDEMLAERYWRAVVSELEACARARYAGHSIDTIYFGGGTPSLLPAAHIEAMLEACRGLFDLMPDCEVSMEANPGTLETGKLRVYQAAGVNRISLGAQSFSDAELAVIGRIHSSAQIWDSVALLRASGFENLNLDLILGLPGQTESQWRSSLECALRLAPWHLSLYMLELDAKVPLYHSVSAGICHVPEDDEVAEWYLYAIEFLEDHGYLQYEISNFSRPGCECRHNLKYWRRQPVLAFGVAAHSHDGSARSANVTDLLVYLCAVEEGRSPVAWREPTEAGRDLEETIFLGLRLNEGLDWGRLRQTCDSGRLAGFEASFRELTAAGLLQWHDSVVRLTRRGMLLSNEVFQRFIQLV
jgi:oxygen-independent coproporphyrinogen III oxidase